MLTPTSNFDIFMDNYFTSFRLHTHLGVNNIQAAGVLNKNRICEMHYHWGQAASKKERCHFYSVNLIRTTAVCFT